MMAKRKRRGASSARERSDMVKEWWRRTKICQGDSEVYEGGEGLKSVRDKVGSCC